METPGSQSKEYLEGWFSALTAVKEAMKGDMDIDRLWTLVLDARQELYTKAHPEQKGVLLWE